MSSNKKLMGREAASSADDQTGVVLTVKPHAFGGAVLSPKHARELNPSLCLNIVTALSSEFSRKAVVPYTLWITEAWRVLGWAEPSAALFWEMATMYHTLYLAARIESGDVIPPILSCGSHSSMGSVTPIEQHGRINKQKYTTTAKDLPVWLIGTFLLLHCEDSTYAFEESSDGRAGSSEHALWQQRHIPTRYDSNFVVSHLILASSRTPP
jgi:TBCC domain-containing protein 1